MGNARNQGRLIWGASGAVVLGLAALALYATRSDPAVTRLPIPGEGDSLAVEVLNGAAADGLARVTSNRLRGLGIDVVFFGTARDSIWKRTEVLARRGDTAAARRVAQALGFGEVKVALDSRLLLDVSVYLGLDAISDSAGINP